MSDASAFGFGKFIPGFEFLQNLGKAGAGTGGMPSFAHWVAPTVSVEELEKRIDELKAVQFWLEQNGKALSATVQALEVQRMTLSTLKGMNVYLGDLGQVFPFSAAAAASPADAATQANPLAGWPMSASTPPESVAPTASAPDIPAQEKAAPSSATDKPESPAQGAGMAQAMQWWGALTQQFQHIAQQAMQDPAQQQAMLQATQMGSEFAKTAVKTASDMVRQTASKVPKATAPSRAAKAAAQPPAKTPAKTAQRSSAQPAAKRKAPAKKAVRVDKQAPVAASRSKSVAAKKSTASQPRSR